MSNISSEVSAQTQLRLFAAGVTFTSRCTFGACVGVYLVSSLAGVPFSAVCLAPQPVFHGQVYRLLTSALSHAGLLHLGMNMAALLGTGPALERQLGSLQLLWLLSLMWVLGGALYVVVAAAFAAWAPMALVSWWPALDFGRQCAVGFSGVLFGLLLVEAAAAGAGARRSVFGLFSLPARIYPWALLVLWQLIVPQASLLGHAAGLLVGELYVLGALRWAMPSSSTYHSIERSAACAACMRSQSFIAHTGGGGDGLLPVSYEPLSPRSPGGRLFPYLPFPGSSHRLAGLFASPASAQASSSPTPAPEQQPAPRLGGGEAPADAKAAAAAAAAARAAGK